MPVFELALSGAVIGQCIFTIALLAPWAQTQNTTAMLRRLAPAIVCAVAALSMANELAFALPNPPGWLYGWDEPLQFLLPLAIWLYVRSVTKHSGALTKADYPHLILILLGWLFLAPYLLTPSTQRMAIHAGEAPPGLYLGLSAAAATITWWVALLWCGYSCVRRLRRYRRALRRNYSNVDDKDLRWLDALLVVLASFFGLEFAEESLSALLEFEVFSDLGGAFRYLAMCFVFGYLALQHRDFAPPPLMEAAPSNAQTPTKAGASYARSALTKDDHARIAQKLGAAMECYQLWRRSALSLKDLSKASGVSVNHLSETLNLHLGKNFYDYVNARRIKDAKELLVESDLTILAICETVGFNAKSTFNTAFKRFAGKTPSQFRANARNVKKS